ncbi:hypothetical protein [Streptomyces sp. NPDC006879]|uniref:hypothetical protein n=1 Tax=Streptomyces sp. NPDC006879 TaxID=3364767 RepID=UPI0036CEBB21
MNRTPNHTDHPSNGGINQNAGSDSQVGGQLAVNVNHGNVTQYVVGPDATPKELYQKGCWLLEAGLRGRAEELIYQAIHRRFCEPEVLYHWGLAIVSRRAVEDLTPADMDKLHALGSMLDSAPDSTHTSAARALLQLVDEALAVPHATGADELAARRGHGSRAINSLPPEQRAELQDHLRHYLSEITREQLDGAEEQDIRAHRTDRRREERVPLFFEPDPLAPVKVPVLELPLKLWYKVLSCSGALLVLASLYFGVPPAFHGSAPQTVIGLLLSVGGGAAAVRFGMDRRWLRARIEQEDQWFERGGPQTRKYNNALPSHLVPEPSPNQHDFAQTIGKLINSHFRAQPRQGEDRDAWWAATRIARQNLRVELADLYGEDADPYSLDWLVRLHAQTTADRWRDGQLGAQRTRRRVPWLTNLGYWGGLALLLIGLVQLGSAATVQEIGPVSLATILLGLGALCGLRGGYPLYADFLRTTLDHEEFDARLREEQRAFEQWQAFLQANRPSDWEMGRWLNYDTRFLRRDALKSYDLRHHEVVYDFFVLEAGEKAQRARVRNGPVRYSIYRIRLYVMTEGGIRQATWTMQFNTATHSGRSDSSFRYDSISSINVERASVQRSDRVTGETQAVTVQSDGSIRGNHTGGDELMLSEDLVIERDSSHLTRLRVENFTSLRGSNSEDLESLLQLSQEASGISTASRILVAVSAEGKQWFETQRRRQSMRFAESSKRATGRHDPKPRNISPITPPPPDNGPHPLEAPYDDAEGA